MQSRSGYHSVSILLSSLVNHTSTLMVLFGIFLFSPKKKKKSMTRIPIVEIASTFNRTNLLIAKSYFTTALVTISSCKKKMNFINLIYITKIFKTKNKIKNRKK